MKISPFSPSPQLYWRLIVPLGLLVALAAQLVATRCGLGLTSDSYLFLDGAMYFSGSTGGAMAAQKVFQAKPPLFPFLLSLLPRAGYVWLFTALILVNLGLLAVIIERALTSTAGRTMAFLAIAFFTPLIMVHVYLWTEPVFLMFFYLAILIVVQATSSGVTTRYMIILAGLAIAMVMTRHVGLFFILGLGLALATTAKIGWQRALIIVLPAIMVFILWNFGWMTDGTAERLTTLKSPVAGGTWARLKNFEYFAGAAATWVLPNALPKLLRISGLILVLAVVIYGGRPGLRKSALARSLLIITVIYYGLMHVSFLIDESSADRYLMPIYPLVIIALALVVEKTAGIRQKWLLYLVIIWLFYPLGRTVKNAMFWQEKICQERVERLEIDRNENSQARPDQ